MKSGTSNAFEGKPVQTIPDLDDDVLDLDDLLGDEIEEENYIDGVDTTYFLCPKCNHSRWKKWGWDCLIDRFDCDLCSDIDLPDTATSAMSI